MLGKLFFNSNHVNQIRAFTNRTKQTQARAYIRAQEKVRNQAQIQRAQIIQAQTAIIQSNQQAAHVKVKEAQIKQAQTQNKQTLTTETQIKNQTPQTDIQTKGSYTSNLPIKIVRTKKAILVHPIGHYILCWEITDSHREKTWYIENLIKQTRKEIRYDYDTESLIIPRLMQFPSRLKSSLHIPIIYPPKESADKLVEPSGLTNNLEIEPDEEDIEFRSNQPWYSTPPKGTPIIVDLWLIPPTVIAIHQNKDSECVMHVTCNLYLQ